MYILAQSCPDPGLSRRQPREKQEWLRRDHFWGRLQISVTQLWQGLSRGPSGMWTAAAVQCGMRAARCPLSDAPFCREGVLLERGGWGWSVVGCVGGEQQRRPFEFTFDECFALKHEWREACERRPFPESPPPPPPPREVIEGTLARQACAGRARQSFPPFPPKFSHPSLGMMVIHPSGGGGSLWGFYLFVPILDNVSSAQYRALHAAHGQSCGICA